jgi:cytochrome c556
LAACAANQPATQPAQATPQAQLMQQMLADIDRVRAFVYGGGSQNDATNAANDLVSSSNRLAELFPPAQASVDYVDMSPQRARAAPAAMHTAASLLLAAVATGDRAAVGNALGNTERNGCGACHLSSSR